MTAFWALRDVVAGLSYTLGLTAWDSQRSSRARRAGRASAGQEPFPRSSNKAGVAAMRSQRMAIAIGVAVSSISAAVALGPQKATDSLEFARRTVQSFIYDLDLDDSDRHSFGQELVDAFAPNGNCTAPANQLFVLVGYGPGLDQGADPVVQPKRLPGCLRVKIFEMERSSFETWRDKDKPRFLPEERRRIDFPRPRTLGVPSGMGAEAASHVWRNNQLTGRDNVPEMESGDDFINEHVFMLSVDVQDGELAVLKGLENTVTRYGVDVIIAEITTITQRGPALLDWFDRHDYIVFDFVPMQYCDMFVTRGLPPEELAKLPPARGRYCDHAVKHHGDSFTAMFPPRPYPSWWIADFGRPRGAASFESWFEWHQKEVDPGNNDLVAVHRSFLRESHLDNLKALACRACKMSRHAHVQGACPKDCHHGRHHGAP